MSTAVSQAEVQLAKRNREVLLAAGREAKERAIEKEFERINDTVHKDLSNYPALNRGLNEVIRRIEEDHQESIEVPPSPPAWVKAVEAVAKIDARQGIGAGNVLGDIHKSLVRAHQEAMVIYRASCETRHELLRNMIPYWRSIQHKLDHVNKSVESLLHRSVAIDRHMEEYEDILRGSDRSVSILSSSTLVYFFVSALVLTVAIGDQKLGSDAIQVGQPFFINAFQLQGCANRFDGDVAVCSDLAVVPHPFQESVYDTRGSPRPFGKFDSGFVPDCNSEQCRRTPGNFYQVCFPVKIQASKNTKPIPQRCRQQTDPGGCPHQRKAL